MGGRIKLKLWELTEWWIDYGVGGWGSIPVLHWEPRSLLPYKHRGQFIRAIAARNMKQVPQLYFYFEIKNMWSHTFTSLHAFRRCCSNIPLRVLSYAADNSLAGRYTVATLQEEKIKYKRIYEIWKSLSTYIWWIVHGWDIFVKVSGTPTFSVLNP